MLNLMGPEQWPPGGASLSPEKKILQKAIVVTAIQIVFFWLVGSATALFRVLSVHFPTSLQQGQWGQQ